MFKVGDKVVIKERDQIGFMPPYDGVVLTSCFLDHYLVKFSDGGEENIHKSCLDEYNEEDQDEAEKAAVILLLNKGYLVEKL